MRKFVAEDGVERLIVVILAVEQQAGAAGEAAGDAHRPRQAVHHADILVGKVGLEGAVAIKVVEAVQFPPQPARHAAHARPRHAPPAFQKATQTQARHGADDKADERAQQPHRARQRCPVRLAQGGQGRLPGGGNAQIQRQRAGEGRGEQSVKIEQSRPDQRHIEDERIGRAAQARRGVALPEAPGEAEREREKQHGGVPGQHAVAEAGKEALPEGVHGMSPLFSVVGGGGRLSSPRRVYFPATSSI